MTVLKIDRFDNPYDYFIVDYHLVIIILLLLQKFVNHLCWKGTSLTLFDKYTPLASGKKGIGEVF